MKYSPLESENERDTDFEVVEKKLIENTNSLNSDNLVSSNAKEKIKVENDKTVTMEGDDGNEERKVTKCRTRRKAAEEADLSMKYLL